VPTTTRRLAALTLAALVGLTIVGPASATGLVAFDAPTLAQARADLATFVNAQRVGHGLVPLQLNSSAIAWAVTRADAMASMDQLSHTGTDGRTVFDAIRASGMTWYAAGEVLAFNTYPDEPTSTAQTVADWLASPAHASILLSNDYNYVGFGAAVSATGARYYAGVFLKLPDRTAGWARTGTASTAAIDAALARVVVRWSGADTRLQVLTAGLRDFEVQRRVAGGTWLSVGTTTHTSMAFSLARRATYEFRIRSRDNAGNRSSWSLVTVTT
jgi:uncharacterized protein YkwD